MKLRIQSVLQEAQERGTSSEFAVALVVFFVESDGRCYAGCSRVKQTVGASYDQAPLEISAPLAYQGPTIEFSRLHPLIENAYREAIGNMPDVQKYVCNVFHFT